ncbi:hypothetical protein SEA_REINDEER_63 [Mycobacterium phage Reindeer]|uniref:Uncharacterized protein n=1 Tax=Mycobacterium phage Reindeer TaxID=2762283 RepID=A0A7G8LI01_9CAUD|nr:hypothetical protein J4U05_gp063 [Mycobacterium phage Reindeer]QNJ56873.1 hypothetical protein SEA_REINDEER_63 [Mycobacterium phage Reindeer]
MDEDKLVNEIGLKYPLPFILAEQPRMMLNFLAQHSNIPDAYRDMIAAWLLEYNVALTQFMLEHYGEEGAEEANLYAVAMAAVFLDAVAAERKAADQAMFDGLERDVFGDGVPE